jgi:hypothetical protein
LADFSAQIAAILLGLKASFPTFVKQGIATLLIAIGVAGIGIDHCENRVLFWKLELQVDVSTPESLSFSSFDFVLIFRVRTDKLPSERLLR